MGEAGKTYPFSLVRLRTHDIFTLQRDSFTHKCFYTGRGLHTEMGLRREMISQRNSSTYRYSYTEMLSTRRCFYTQALQDAKKIPQR